MRPVIERRFIAKLLDRQVGHDVAAMLDDKALGRRGVTDHGEIEPPFPEDRFGLFLLLGLEHHEHALLAFREHHLVGAHAGLAGRHRVEIELDAEVAFGAHFHRRTSQPRRAHVLDRDHATLFHDLETCFQQQLLGEGIADLHGRALFRGIIVKFRRGHRGAVDAVAAGLRAEIDDRHVHAGSRRIEDLVGVGEAHRHRVDEDIAVIAGVETHLPAHRRHAERIAVAADAGDHAGNQMPRLRMLRRAEAQRIEARDRPRAHGEDVAQNAADAGGRALIGLDIARVVVALHLEHHRLAVADVDHAGVLARSLDHPGRLGRQSPQMDARGFVRAVLVPHRRENPELGEGRHPPDQFQNALILVRLEPVGGDEFGGDLGLVHGSLIRKIEAGRKGLLWRFSALSRALQRLEEARELHNADGSDLRTGTS